MKIFLLITITVALFLHAQAIAAPKSIKVTNRQFPDGSGSSKTVDPEKGTAEETFLNSSGKITHKIVYLLDERQQPLSALYYTPKGALVYKIIYKLDGADRIALEIVNNPAGKLLFTREYQYGAQGKVIGMNVYDSQNRLLPPPPKSGNSSKKRR